MYLLWHIHHHHHAVSASLGDLLAVCALALAWFTFRQGRLASSRADVNAARALLQRLNDRFFPDIADAYFSTAYTEEVAEERSKQYRGNIETVYILPEEPIAALAADQRAVAEDLMSAETVRLAAFAQWQIAKVNELIRQQMTFNAVHVPDFRDKSLPTERREALADGGVAMSKMLHGGIGNAKEEWYEPLKESVNADLARLASRNGWLSYARRNVGELFGDAFVAGALIVVLLAYIHIL